MCTPRQNNKKGNKPKILLSSKKLTMIKNCFCVLLWLSRANIKISFLDEIR